MNMLYMKGIFGLAFLITSLAASAESPFSLRPSNPRSFKNGVRVLDPPGSVAARNQASEDLLGIRHYHASLRPDQDSGGHYQLKLVQVEESGTEKILEQVDVKSKEEPLGGVGISILPSSLSVRIKIYTSSTEALHEVSAKNVGKLESSIGDDGVLLRYVVDEKPILKLLWSKVEDK